MGNTLLAAGTSFDPGQCAPYGAEVQQLAWRVARCADEVDAVVARLGQLLMEQWLSPAGRAYRSSLALRMAELRRARDALQEASAVVMHHSAKLALASRPGY